MLMQEFDNHWFNRWVFKKTDPATSCVEPTCFWISINSEERIVTATDNRMEMVRRVYLVHRIGKQLRLLVGHKVIVRAVNNQYGRLALMHVGDRTCIAP